MHRYMVLELWIELVQLLERGRFDALFIADVVVAYEVFRGNRDAAVRAADQVPAARSVTKQPFVSLWGLRCRLVPSGVHREI